MTHTHARLPDTRTVPSQLIIRDRWTPAGISDLIRSKCTTGDTPAYLVLGRREAELLREHLEQAFGPGTVPTLKGTYYMGLEVIPIDAESFVRVDGKKPVRTRRDPVVRRPEWRNREIVSLWRRLRIA
jgi:hypothetical protein